MRIQVYKEKPLINTGAPVIARVYKGDPKTDPKKPGRDTKHFRFVFEDSPVFDKAIAESAFLKLYGSNPSVLRNVHFMIDDAEMVFSNAMEEWRMSQKGRPIQWRKCDGHTMYVHYQGETCIRTPTPCQQQCQCKPTGRLLFWLPEFTQETGILGQFMLITHSIKDVQNIQGTIDWTLNEAGRLRNIAFVLYRRDANLTTPDGAPVTKSLVYLEAAERTAQMAALAAREAALSLSDGVLPALPAPTVIEPDVIETEQDAGESSFTFIVAVERRLSGQQTRYILDTDTGHKITIFTREKFRDAGYDVESWADIKGRLVINQIPVQEVFDGQYWQLDAVHPLIGSSADSIPF